MPPHLESLRQRAQIRHDEAEQDAAATTPGQRLFEIHIKRPALLRLSVRQTLGNSVIIRWSSDGNLYSCHHYEE